MTSTARERIASLLEGIGTGSFASRRTAPADDLVLAVTGVGPLHFPIQRAQAQNLLRKARPARYGRREQTLLDPRVRDTGEIPAGRVKIDRRRWNRTLRPMLDALGSDLGLAPGQRFGAELHSLLIYGPGQFFKQHQDSEGKEGMVGTLVVTLPSRFTGGSIVIEHQGERVAYRATKQPLSFIAFYADCRHEVRPVRSGYRIVLTYDLLLEGEATGAVAPPPAVVDGLAALLREHFTTPLPASPYASGNASPREPPSRLVYLLDHEYTQRGLGWERLKGDDVSRAAALRAAAERTDCELALGLATVHETRECEEPWEPSWHERRRWQRDEDDDWLPDDEPLADDPDAYLAGDLIDSSVTLERWIDPRGGASAPVLTAVEAHEICASTPSSALTPYAAEYEGYMGNYGNTMDRWYRRAAIVLWPRERSFAVRAEASPRWALEALAARLRAGELQESRKLAASLLPFWSEVVARADRPAPLFARVLQVAAALESQDLAAALLRPFHLTVVTPRAARDFAALLDRYGEAWGRLLLGGWAQAEWGMRAGSRDVLAWLTALRAVCAGCSAARCPGGATATRLLVEEGWGALRGEIEGRRGLLPPSQRERELAALARPILGWLGGAAIVEEDTARASPTRARRAEGPIARAIGYLCADENTALVPCLMHLLRAAAKSVKSERRGTLGLDAIGHFCAVEIAARLATAPRQPDDWSIGLPAGCDCVLCHRLGAFLSDPAQRQLEWPLAKAGRQHVHQRIDRHELPVRHQTRRSGSPYTLVLEKTKTLFAREAAARHAWQVDLDWLSGAGWTAPASGARRGTR
jgi:hypothetical protein